MNDEHTGEALTHESATDWERLRHISDADNHVAVASDPDIISTDEDFWKNAKVTCYSIGR
jgi:hypothetical protein